MKKFVLAPLAVATLAVLSTPSYAIYNLYKENGLSFDVSGEINLYGEKDSVKATGQADILSEMSEKASDERTRLYSNEGASYIDFRGSQDLGKDWRVTGTLGMGYAKANSSSSYLNTASLSFDKLNFGAITFGRQYLHTGFVTRTNTYTPLDVFGEQAIRLDYYGLKNLHTSAYYLFPSGTNVNTKSNSAKTEGFGASASYNIPFTNSQNLRLAAGYTNSHANPRDERASTKQQGYALSAEYRIGKALAAFDFGKSDADLDGSIVVGSKGDYVGAKIGYEITPKINLVAGYGSRTAKATYKAGVTAADAEAAIYNNADYYGLSNHLLTSLMYEKLTQKQTYVRGDYYLRDNVRLYGQVQKEKTQAKLSGQDYAKLDDTSYRIGVALSF